MTEIIDPWAGDPSYPPPPDFTPLAGNEARFQRWGRFRWEPVGDSRIRVLGDWRRRNIVKVDCPALDHFGKGIWLHREVAPRFLSLVGEWEREGLLGLILTWNGSYVARRIRGRRSLSNHAFGTAFDINARWNPLGKRPALTGEKGSVRDLVPIAARNGFYWGGWYSGRRDGMHFESA